MFDAAFLAEHIVNAWNLQIAVAQGLAERAARIQLGLPEDEASNPLAAFARMADVYRFRNIGNRFADGANSVTVLTQRINQALNQGQDSSRMFVFSLAPILYHELGHLHDGTSGSFLEFLQDVARNFASPKILQREEAADQFAVEKMQELALAIPHFDFYDYESMTSSVLLMRDTVLFDVFSGFRALPSEDHFIHLVHEDCRRNPSTADFNFYDPRKVKFAFHDFFSFLTAGEFAELHRKVLATIGAGTHAHNFVRGARIINALTTLAGQVSAPSDDNLMDWYTHFLAAMQKNDPQFLTERLTPAERLAEAVEPYRMILNLVGSGATGLGLKFKSFSRSLDLDYQPVINCPPGMCMVGFLKDGQKGFVEIGGPLDNLSSIRLV